MSQADFPSGVCALPDWAVLRASGADAATFLHSQLTQAVSNLPADQARLGGYCTAKGRLQANFVLRRDGDDVLLILPTALREGLRKRLSMFVLRAKAQLLADETALHGVVGTGGPELPVWGVQGPWLRLPDSLGQKRWLHLGADLGAVEGPALAHEAWDWLDVHAALPWVQAGTTEHHVPQMINQDIVGGVNFQKGCYPGQEVVARSQYRGTVKRRSFLFASDAALDGVEPGAPIFHSGDAEQPAGEVLARARWEGRSAVLAEVRLAALDEGELRLQGELLKPLPMPYDVQAPA